jgi:hypothetical protein
MSFPSLLDARTMLAREPTGTRMDTACSGLRLVRLATQTPRVASARVVVIEGQYGPRVAWRVVGGSATATTVSALRRAE